MKWFLIALCTASSALRARSASNQMQTPPAMEWQAGLGGNVFEFFGAVRESADGGYFVGGTSYSGANGNKTATNFGYPDYWLVHLNSRGEKLWDKGYGGSQANYLTSLVPTADGGCVLGGYSSSGVTGTKSSTNYGGADYWVVRVSPNGAVLWDRSYGGSADDHLRAMIPTTDGGFLLGGDSNSGADGTKTSAALGTNGTPDYWVVRLDAAGNQLWDKAYGGGNEERLTCLRQTTDGGFILGGYSLSGMSGNKTSTNFTSDAIQPHSDYWVVRVDQNGEKLWDKSFGGSLIDRPFAIIQTHDGGYAVGGMTESENDGNKTAPRINQNYGYDFWVVRLDPDGNMLWDREFGAIDGDSGLTGLEETEDGGLLLGGLSAGTPSGNKTSPLFGASDLWLARLDSDGNLLWDQSYGGTDADDIGYSPNPTAFLSQTTDGGLLLGSSSQSGVGGNKSVPNYGLIDFWVTKLSWSVRPQVQVTSNRVVYQMNQCQHSGSNQSLRVWNAGTGLMAYTVTSSVPWITIKPMRGTSAGETNTHTLMLNVAALPAADYPASVDIIPDGASPNGVDLLLNLLPPATPYNLLSVPINPFPFQTQTRFNCVLLGLPNRLYVIETSTNLIDWRPQQTNLATCAGVQITNLVTHQTNGFFYRARLL